MELRIATILVGTRCRAAIQAMIPLSKRGSLLTTS
jgi:hypothetical protein